MIKLTTTNSFYSLEELIDDSQYRLGIPAFQRTFCWNKDKIIFLLDSCMRNFYIGTIHLARLPENYDTVYSINNSEISERLVNTKSLYIVLDGLQRLTAINIALNGTYNNKYLYINLLYKNETPDINEPVYKFKFLSESQVNESKELWFKLKDIIDCRQNYKIHRLLETNEKFISLTESEKDLAESILNNLINCVQEKNVPVHIEDGDEDSCIESFIRINKGGVNITVSDIVFAKMQLYSPKLNRNELESIVSNFTQAYNYQGTVKNLLNIILNFLPNTSRYKISSFNKNTISYLNINFEKIISSIENSLKLCNQFNINLKYIPDVLITILALYLYDKDINWIYSTEKENNLNKLNIFKYLILNTLKKDTGIGGNVLKHLLPSFQSILMNSANFDYVQLLKLENKTSDLSDAEIDLLLESKYNSIKCNFLLYLLFYKSLTPNCHIDHIFPISKFKNTSYYDKANSIVNLEILDANENLSKNAKSFEEWVASRTSDFAETHLIPNSISDFETFYEARKILLKQKIKEFINL